MRLSLYTDYALRTLLFLATRGGRSTSTVIADYYGISANHLIKVVHRLGKLEYVRNLRGPGGGVELAKPADRITVGTVIRAFEGTTHLLDCVSTPNVCVIQPGCSLRGVLIEAERRQMEYLDSVTLQSLIPPLRDLASFRSVEPDVVLLGPPPKSLEQHPS